MKQSTVAKLPGLYLRGTVWQLRVMIPLELQPAYKGRTKLIRSLDTSDWREASRKGAAVRAQLLQEFEEKARSLNPEPVAQITPELGQTIGARIRARLLEWDETLRGDPKMADLWLRFADAFSYRTLTKLRLGPPAEPSLPAPSELAELAKRSPFDGLTPMQLSRLAEVNASADEAAALQLASRSLSAVTAMADSEARKLGLLVDWKRPEARPVLLDCLRAYRAAHADIVKRDEGEDVVTPQAPAKVPEKAATKLREVFNRWKAVKQRTEDSVRACERALALYEERTNDTPVQALTRAQGDDFRAWLQTLGTSSKTAHGRCALGWTPAQFFRYWPAISARGRLLQRAAGSPREPPSRDHRGSTTGALHGSASQPPRSAAHRCPASNAPAYAPTGPHEDLQVLPMGRGESPAGRPGGLPQLHQQVGRQGPRW